jgi:hypothetical protein
MGQQSRCIWLRDTEPQPLAYTFLDRGIILRRANSAGALSAIAGSKIVVSIQTPPIQTTTAGTWTMRATAPQSITICPLLSEIGCYKMYMTGIFASFHGLRGRLNDQSGGRGGKYQP